MVAFEKAILYISGLNELQGDGNYCELDYWFWSTICSCLSSVVHHVKMFFLDKILHLTPFFFIGCVSPKLLIAIILNFSQQCLKKRMPSSEKVDLRTTDVENWLLTQETATSRKAYELFCSTSYVKLIDRCLLLTYVLRSETLIVFN